MHIKARFALLLLGLHVALLGPFAPKRVVDFLVNAMASVVRKRLQQEQQEQQEAEDALWQAAGHDERMQETMFH